MTGLHIDGFGVFHNLTVERLSPKLTVFLGHNESGKSTLLGFIRAIFFGFPDGRSNENPYPPIAGGRHGGSINITLDNKKKYIVERRPGPGGGKIDILKPDQTHGGKETLLSILGTDNRLLFKNIYAFSLSELQHFETLNTNSVREALYSAGAGIDPKALMGLKSSLDKKENELFKPGGTKPKINKILSRLTAIQKEKKAIQNTMDQYDDLKSQINDHSKEILKHEKKRTANSIELQKTETWIQIWPEWINLSIARGKLEKLDPIESFPSLGLAKLEGLHARVEDLKRERLKIEEELKRQKSEVPPPIKDQHILSHSLSIKQLQKDMGHFEAVVQEILSIYQEIHHAEQRLKQDLIQLGPSWEEQRVQQFDLSISVREDVRRFLTTLGTLKLNEQRMKDLLEAAKSKEKDTEARTNEISEPTIKDHEYLRRMKSACQELRALESHGRLVKEEWHYIVERLNDIQEQKEILSTSAEKEKSRIPLWLILMVLGLVTFFFIWIGIDTHWSRSILILFSSIPILLGVLIWTIRAKMERMDLNQAHIIEQRSVSLFAKKEDLEKRKTELDGKIRFIDEQIASKRSILSLHETPSITELDNMEQEFTDRIAHLAQWQTAIREMGHIKRNRETAEENFNKAKIAADEIRDSWSEFLQNRNLDTMLSPEGVLEAFSLIQSCKEQIENLQRLQSKMKSLKEARQRYLDLAKEVFESCNRKPVEDDEIPAAVQNLIQDFLDSEKAFEKREILLKEIEANSRSVNRMNGEMEKLQNEIKDLLAGGGADDDETFRKRADIFEERAKLKKDIQNHEDNIKRLSGKWGEWNKLIKTLTSLDLEKLERQKITLEREQTKTETVLDQLKKGQARMEEQTHQLINDERISELRTEEEGFIEELSLLADEWITLKMAQGLVKMARKRYEKERQPKIISEAGHFFNKLTLQKYKSIVAPIGEDRIEVLCRDNSRKEIEQLSRGTAEQLYLSLRFGFINEFSKRTGSLPIIMDEILVNFDMDRTKTTIKSIVELSRQHQILFFTCHPLTVSLFKEADPNILSLEIAESRIKEWHPSR